MDFVAQAREPRLGELDADLVRPAGPGPDAQQACARQALWRRWLVEHREGRIVKQDSQRHAAFLPCPAYL